MGILTEPKSRGGDHGGGAARAEMTEAERRERAVELARRDWAEVEKALSVWCAKGRWEHFSNLELQKARETLTSALALIPKPETRGK